MDSLDVMRGFSMFWLIGGAALVHGIANHHPSAITEAMANQMRHAGWQGFRFYDLIFPLFIFTSGATIPISISQLKKKGINNTRIIAIAARRTLILMILGTIYNEWSSHQFFNPRLCSVLGQIGASYFISTCIYLFNSRSRSILASTCTIWILIAALQLLPSDAVLSENINSTNNINSWIDSTLTPGRLLNENHDPEGLLNWLSASSVCLLGTWTSRQITQTNPNQISRRRKIIHPSALGIALISFSLLADNYYPIVKSIWTTPFTALTGGISILLYLLTHYLVDIKSIKRPFLIFKIIGVNSLIAYFSLRFFGYGQFTKTLGAQLSNHLSLDGEILGILLTMVATIWILFWMQKSKIFIKV